MLSLRASLIVSAVTGVNTGEAMMMLGRDPGFGAFESALQSAAKSHGSMKAPVPTRSSRRSPRSQRAGGALDTGMARIRAGVGASANPSLSQVAHGSAKEEEALTLLQAFVASDDKEKTAEFVKEGKDAMNAAAWFGKLGMAYKYGSGVRGQVYLPNGSLQPTTHQEVEEFHTPTHQEVEEFHRPSFWQEVRDAAKAVGPAPMGIM